MTFRLMSGEHTAGGQIFFMFAPEQSHRYQPVAGGTGFIEKGRPERVYPVAGGLERFPYSPLVLVESDVDLVALHGSKFQRWNP